MSNTSIKRCIEVLEYAEKSNWREAMSYFGIKSKDTLKIYLKKLKDYDESYIDRANKILDGMLEGRSNKEKEVTEIVEKFEKDINDEAGIGTISSTSIKIKTVDEAIAFAGIDTELWEAYRSKTNHWDVTMKMRDANGVDHAKTVRNYQITVWLKRQVKNFVEEGLKELLDRFEKTAPEFSTPIVKDNKENCLVEIAIFDQHLAKLCLHRETTTEWNLKISRDSYVYSFLDLLKKAQKLKGDNIEKILVPLGQDFFHINDASNKTPAAKNELDVDDRLDLIFSTGVEALILCIVEANKIAPVDVIYSPGNHDQSSTYFLCKILEVFFKNTDSVTVDVTPEIRKAVTYGNNFIGFAHWQKKSVDALATIFSTHPVYGPMWGNSKYKEIHTGHFHKKDEISFLPVITDRAVMIRRIPSLTGTDFWHYSHGFVPTTRMAECYIYDFESGPAGYFSSVHNEDIEK